MATSDTTSEGSERMAATPASAAVSGGEGAAAKALSLGEISGVHLGGPEPNVTIFRTVNDYLSELWIYLLWYRPFLHFYGIRFNGGVMS